MFEQQMFEMTQLIALKERQQNLFHAMTQAPELDETTLERLAHRRFVRQFKFRSLMFRLAPRFAGRMML